MMYFSKAQTLVVKTQLFFSSHMQMIIEELISTCDPLKINLLPRVGFGMEFFRDFLVWDRSKNSKNPKILGIGIGI